MDPYSPNQPPQNTQPPNQTYPPQPAGQSHWGQSSSNQNPEQGYQSNSGYPPSSGYPPRSGDISQSQPQPQPYSQPQYQQTPQYPNHTQPQSVGQFNGQPQNGYSGQNSGQNQPWGFNRPEDTTPVYSQTPGDPRHQLPSTNSYPPNPSGNLNPQNIQLTPSPLPKRYDKQPLLLRLVEWLRGYWWAPVLVILGLVTVADIAYQVILPYDRIPSGVKVDGFVVGGLKKGEAIDKLNKAYADSKVKIFFGDASVPQQTPRVADLGISVNNKERLEKVSYPVWLRMIPTSSLWVASTQSIAKPNYSYDTVVIDEYTLRNLGSDCRIEPKDATIRLDDGLFKSVASEPGGNCDVAEFKSKVRTAILENGEITIKIGIDEEDARLSEEGVAGLVEQLNRTLGKNIPISAGSVNHEIPSSEAKSWLSFNTVIPEAVNEDGSVQSPYIGYNVDRKYIQEFIDKSKLSEAIKKPGVTKISTHNYQETGRSDGVSGTAIDVDASIAGFRNVADGRSENVVVPIAAVGPTVEFSRTYDPTHEGFRALVEHFSSDNGGKVGIVVTDLNGREPRVDIAVAEREKVVAGGIDGLFLAYAAQVGVDDGTLQSTARVSGSRDYKQCIELAIVSQDQDCIDGLLNTMGNAFVQEKMNQAGLSDTSFSGEQNVTSARDIHTLIRSMDAGTSGLKSKSALLSMMKKSLIRDGFFSALPSNTSVASSRSGNIANQGALVSSGGKFVVSFASEGVGGLEIIDKFIKSYEELRSKKASR